MICSRYRAIPLMLSWNHHGGPSLLAGQCPESAANAIIAVRYDANDVMEGITEVLAYGTAIVVEKT